MLVSGGETKKVFADIWPIKLPPTWKALMDCVAKTKPRQAAQLAHLKCTHYAPDLIILVPQSQLIADAFKADEMLQWHLLRYLAVTFQFKGRLEVKKPPRVSPPPPPEIKKAPTKSKAIQFTPRPTT